ncbi:MAG: hypothetical protein SFX73_35590 [Kofleriaceae bacterium]|nr:hypothetical protein [Kofleriaceae bacterium]
MRRCVLVVSGLVSACAAAGVAPDGGGSGDNDGQMVVDAARDNDGQIIMPDAFDPRKGWVDLGSPPAATSGDVSSPKLTFAANGDPVVAYSANQYVQVHRYANDSSWMAVGSPLRHSTASNVVTYDPTPVLTADGLSVVWPEWSNGAMSSGVRREQNGSWVAPPGAGVLGTPGAYCFLPHSTAAVDADGAMWIAYSETTDLNGQMRINVVSVLGSNVSVRGQSIAATTSNTNAIGPDVEIGGNSVFMTWHENGVRLAKRNTTTGGWDAFAGSPFTVAGRAVSSQANGHLAVDPMGRPIIAFTSSNGTENGIYVGRYDGAAWNYWGEMVQATPGTVANQSTHPYLYDIVAAGNDAVYIAWTEMNASTYEGVYVYKCTPQGCAAVGRGRLEAAAGNTPGSAPRLAIDAGGRPLVTWTEDDAQDTSKVHVWRYHGDPDVP